MRILAALAGLVVLAGCFGGADRERDPGPDPPEERMLPPGCNATLSAVAHRAGELVTDPPGPIPVGCASSTGRPSFEPTIGITESGTVLLYPASALGVPATVTMARTDDEGATWRIITPGTAGQSTHPYSQDPYLFVDPETDRIFAEDLLLVPPTCGMMSISDDRGETWTHTQAGCAVMDHVTLFQGPPVLESVAPMTYPNVIYRCAITGGAVSTLSTMVACQRSRDGGMTWLPPGDAAFTFLPGVLDPGCDGGNGHGATNEQGTVYLPRGHCGQPWLAISDDEAQTWTTVQVSDLGTVCSPAVCEHDAGVGEDPSGVLYYAWVAADRLPYLARSVDGGTTWDEPTMIAPPGVNEAALLQMAVGGNGKVAIVYYGSTNSPGSPWADADYSNTTWVAYLSMSIDASAAQPLFYTAPLHDPADPLIRGTCGPLRCQEVFDFIDIRIGPDGTAWAPIIDGCVDACATGELQQDNGSVLYAGRLFGGPSLWDEEDPNGPYPGGASE